MAVPGISTLGILVGYGIETTAGEKPATFNLLTRINSVGGINLETEQIDASALEDFVTKYVKGRQDTGGTFPITVNLTDDTAKEWEDAISESETAYKSGLNTWITVWSPYLKRAFFIVCQLPSQIPLPDIDQNGLFTAEMSNIINDYKGLETAVKPVAKS